MRNRVLNNERGSAILIVLLLTAMLSLVAIIAVDNSQTEIDLSFNKIDQEKSFYIAEAGLDHAQAMVSGTPGWNAGFTNVSFGDGLYSVVVTDSLTDPSLADSVRLISRGVIEGSRATLEAMLAPEPFYPFRYGLFADKGITIDNSVGTDSYNSDSGSYASTAEELYGSVGSNGTVTIENNPTIAGDVYSATPGGISITGTGTVLGDTSSTAPALDFSDLIAADQFTWAESVNRAPLGMTGSYTYNNGSRDLYIAGGETMQLESGVYVFDDITLEQSAQLTVAPGAEVEIYMTGDFILRNKAMVNDGGRPVNFQVYSLGNKFQLGQSAEFTGTVVAPNVDFSLSNYADFYGSMMAGRINLANNPGFHYDRSLGMIAMGTTGRIIRASWRELE